MSNLGPRHQDTREMTRRVRQAERVEDRWFRRCFRIAVALNDALGPPSRIYDTKPITLSQLNAANMAFTRVGPTE